MTGAFLIANIIAGLVFFISRVIEMFQTDDVIDELREATGATIVDLITGAAITMIVMFVVSVVLGAVMYLMPKDLDFDEDDLFRHDGRDEYYNGAVMYGKVAHSKYYGA